MHLTGCKFWPAASKAVDGYPAWLNAHRHDYGEGFANPTGGQSSLAAMLDRIESRYAYDAGAFAG